MKKIFNQFNYEIKDFSDKDIDVGPNILDLSGYVENETLIKNLLTMNNNFDRNLGVYDDDSVSDESKEPVRLKDVNIRNIADYSYLFEGNREVKTNGRNVSNVSVNGVNNRNYKNNNNVSNNVISVNSNFQNDNKSDNKSN